MPVPRRPLQGRVVVQARVHASTQGRQQPHHLHVPNRGRSPKGVVVGCASVYDKRRHQHPHGLHVSVQHSLPKGVVVPTEGSTPGRPTGDRTTYIACKSCGQ